MSPLSCVVVNDNDDDDDGLRTALSPYSIFSLFSVMNV